MNPICSEVLSRVECLGCSEWSSVEQKSYIRPCAVARARELLHPPIPPIAPIPHIPPIAPTRIPGTGALLLHTSLPYFPLSTRSSGTGALTLLPRHKKLCPSVTHQKLGLKLFGDCGGWRCACWIDLIRIAAAAAVERECLKGCWKGGLA